jgi:hypothetical protein
MRSLLLLSVLLFSSAIHADENSAIALARADVRSLPEHDQRYMRYVWITDAEKESLQITSLTANYWSTSPIIARPYPISSLDGAPKALVARIDLRRYAPEKHWDKLISIWEEFRYDPAFNLLLTKDTLRFAHGLDVAIPKRKVNVPPYVHTDGKTYTAKWVDHDKDDVVRIVGEHLDKEAIAELIDRTYSQAPIVTHKYFVFRSLSTIKDKGVYATIFGGMYYDLSNTPQKTKNDEEALLTQLGAYKEDFNRSERRTAVFQSDVAGKRPRRIEYVRTREGRVGDNQSIAVFTRDIKRESIDIGQHAMMNLLKFNHDGTEAIYEKANGLQGFAIFDGKGKLLEAVPSAVAVDRTIPTPFSTDLQPAVSCISCHGPEGGWRISRNDVTSLTEWNDDDILADRNRRKTDVFEQLAALYAGDLELSLLPQARNDLARAILLATGPWKDSKGQTDLVKLASARIAKTYGDFIYTSVDAKTCLTDLGIKTDDNKKAREQLEKLLPPLGDLYEEDPRIRALVRGVPINSIDYALIYAIVARRAQISGGNK